MNLEPINVGYDRADDPEGIEGAHLELLAGMSKDKEIAAGERSLQSHRLGLSP